LKNILLFREVKRKVVLASMHSFNPKSMTITFIGTRNIPGMNISMHNALKIPSISKANLRCAGQVCFNPAEKTLLLEIDKNLIVPSEDWPIR